jgi:hypothetical protein
MKYEDARKLFPMMEYTERFKVICENLDHVLSVCEKEDRIDSIRSAANQYEL